MSSQQKKLKKEISRLWKDITKKMQSDILPDQQDCQNLLQKCEEYTVYADKKWFDRWQDCTKEIAVCLKAAQKSNFDLARQSMDIIQKDKKQCHEQFKK